MAGKRPHRFPHNNFSSVYWIFTKLGHMIPLWKGKNPIYFGVITIIPFENLYRRAYFVMHTFLVLFNNISGGAPNYFPNSFSGPADNPQHLESTFNISGDVKRYNTADDDNYSQVGVFWKKVWSLLKFLFFLDFVIFMLISK